MAANKHLSTPNRVIIPVAGALNVKVHTHLPRVRIVSSATFHFDTLRHAFEEDGWMVEEPIVPPQLGLRDISKTHKEVERLINHKLAKHPDKAAVIFGHSLGAKSVARYIIDGQNQDRVAGGIGMDGPHLPIFTGIWRGGAGVAMGHLIDPHSEFFNETARRARVNHVNGSPAKLILIGSTGSDFIAPQGALPELAGAERLLLSHTGEEFGEGVQVLHSPHVNHNGLLLNEATISSIVGSAGTLWQRHEASLAEPLAMTA